MKRPHTYRSIATICCLAILAGMVTVVMQYTPSQALVNRWQSLSGMTRIATMGSGSSTDVSCAISDGKAYCWGSDASGQIGNGATTGNQLLPTRVDGVLTGKTVTDISIGLAYVCAVADGKAYCWGDNQYGQLGDSTTTNRDAPVAVNDSGVLAGKTVTNIAAGHGHACAVADGLAYCWGGGGNGRLGRGSTSSSSVPVAVSTSGALNGKTVVQVGLGSGHSCALTADGIVACWGAGVNGQMGNGTTTTNNTSPVAITVNAYLSGKTITWLGVGNGVSCVIASSLPFCWGYGTNGQMGNGGTTDSTEATPPTMSGVLNGKSFVRIAVGAGRTCTFDTAGLAYCWGAARNGDNTQSQRLTPVAVMTTSPSQLTGMTVNDISVGNSATCVTTTTRQAFCWGVNTVGQLGDNTTTARSAAVAVLIDGDSNLGAYRVYRNANSVTPGSPIAANNTAPVLPYKNMPFRVRLAVNGAGNSDAPIQLYETTASYILQFAQRTAGSCSAQSSGWADVGAGTAIAWQTNGSVSNGATISAYGSDPAVANPVYQTYRSAGTTFNNPNTIPSTGYGLWDFSLRDNNASTSTSYCLRLVYSSGGAPVENFGVYPEIIIADGAVSVDIVDASGVSVSSPSYSFANVDIGMSCQTTTATLSNSSQRVRVTNSMTSGGWSLSIAATDGATAAWVRDDTAQHYDYNDPSGSPPGCGSGSDGDGIAGQLTLSPGASTITPQSGCSATGLSRGSTAGFDQGNTDVVTLVTASSGADLGCYWDITGITASQTIPPTQFEGHYSLTMTVTVVAQ